MPPQKPVVQPKPAVIKPKPDVKPKPQLRPKVVMQPVQPQPAAPSPEPIADLWSDWTGLTGMLDVSLEDLSRADELTINLQPWMNDHTQNIGFDEHGNPLTVLAIPPRMSSLDLENVLGHLQLILRSGVGRMSPGRLRGMRELEQHTHHLDAAFAAMEQAISLNPNNPSLRALGARLTALRNVNLGQALDIEDPGDLSSATYVPVTLSDLFPLGRTNATLLERTPYWRYLTAALANTPQGEALRDGPLLPDGSRDRANGHRGNLTELSKEIISALRQIALLAEEFAEEIRLNNQQAAPVVRKKDRKPPPDDGSSAAPVALTSKELKKLEKKQRKEEKAKKQETQSNSSKSSFSGLFKGRRRSVDLTSNSEASDTETKPDKKGKKKKEPKAPKTQKLFGGVRYQNNDTDASDTESRSASPQQPGPVYMNLVIPGSSMVQPVQSGDDEPSASQQPQISFESRKDRKKKKAIAPKKGKPLKSGTDTETDVESGDEKDKKDKKQRGIFPKRRKKPVAPKTSAGGGASDPESGDEKKKVSDSGDEKRRRGLRERLGMKKGGKKKRR